MSLGEIKTDRWYQGADKQVRYCEFINEDDMVWYLPVAYCMETTICPLAEFEEWAQCEVTPVWKMVKK